MADMSDFKLATFAGGCFWCMVQPFAKLHGVHEVISGYTGGHTENPTYEDVCKGDTGHYEAVQIIYDPLEITYEMLLSTFWMQIDPTDINGQFADRGQQYQTVIFYHDEKQRSLAEESKARLNNMGKFKKHLATMVIPAVKFYPAEEYHQDYYRKNPVRYNYYKASSGRSTYIKKVWNIKNDF